LGKLSLSISDIAGVTLAAEDGEGDNVNQQEDACRVNELGTLSLDPFLARVLHYLQEVYLHLEQAAKFS
jgi:hypothetical protein